MKRIVVVVTKVVFAASMSACDGDPSGGNHGAAAGAGRHAVDSTTAGVIRGYVVLDGEAPANPLLRMGTDPECLREARGPQHAEDYVLGENQRLANVFVYIEDGFNDYVFDPPAATTVRLDQKACRYVPHVAGVRVGQRVEVTNSDPMPHSLQAASTVNAPFGSQQPVRGMKATHVFTKQEVMVPFRCGLHPWTSAYIGVMDHPYFATTWRDGRFELRNVPPGTYTIGAWHERLGVQTQVVTVGRREARDVGFSFKPVATTAPTP